MLLVCKFRFFSSMAGAYKTVTFRKSTDLLSKHIKTTFDQRMSLILPATLRHHFGSILTGPTNEQHLPQSIDNVLDVVSSVVSENGYDLNDINTIRDIHCCLGLQCQFGPGESDMTKALYWYRKAAARDHLLAVWIMRYCYTVGLGVGKEFCLAEVFTNKFSKLLRQYQNEFEVKDFPAMNCASYKLLERMSTTSGNKDVQLLVGVCLRFDLGVRKCEKTAVNWYQLSAEQGNAFAQYNLGLCYDNGEGVEQNYEQAVKWYRRSAEQGNVYAQSNLGFCYENGDGVEKNHVQAVLWYRIAAEQGNTNAQNNLGACYENGEGVEMDEEEAVKWYLLSAEQGNAIAQNNLGLCHDAGKGVEQNYGEAVKWYRLSAEQGNANAQNNLGVCYINGEGVQQSRQQAKKWFQLSAEQGNANAQGALQQLGLTRQQ